MNFRLLFLFLLFGCGVKGNPSAPTGAYVPSVLENFDDVKVEKPVGDAAITGRRRRAR